MLEFGGKSFPIVYIPEDDIAVMSPTRARRANVLNIMHKKLAADRKARAGEFAMLKASLEADKRRRAAEPGLMDWIFGLGN